MRLTAVIIWKLTLMLGLSLSLEMDIWQTILELLISAIQSSFTSTLSAAIGTVCLFAYYGLAPLPCLSF